MTECNALAKGVRKQVRDDKGGRPKWKKILEEDYFKPTLAPGEQPLQPDTIRRQYERLGGANYVITWEKKTAPRRNWKAPTPRFAPCPYPTRSFHLVRSPQQEREDAKREEADAARRAEPRATGYLGTPLKEPPKPFVLSWARAMQPVFGSKAWREHVLAGPDRARSRKAIRAQAAAIAEMWRVGKKLRDEFNAEEWDRIRVAWKLPPLQPRPWWWPLDPVPRAP